MFTENGDYSDPRDNDPDRSWNTEATTGGTSSART